MQRKCRSCGALFTVGGECQDRCKGCIDGVPKEGRMVLGYTPPPKVEEIEEQPIEVEEEYTPPKYWKTCVECGAIFGAYSHKTLACSDECKTNRNRRLTRERKGPTPVRVVKCEECGSEFKTTRKNKKYCSVKCLTKTKNRNYISKNKNSSEVNNEDKD